MSNQLQQEKSPYLQQHKDNPVDWFPWGEAAFQKAREKEKPIFLSIGYSTCHWCHVMAHESFEDPKIAGLLEDFVCIKVDREEHPEVDAVYMAVCQAMTGSGGWPLSVFLTPEGKPFFAGTYFPKTSRYGQTGFMELVRQVALLWRTDRGKLLETGNQITAHLQKQEPRAFGKPERPLLLHGYRLLAQSFDRTFGGFGTAPKFPTPHNFLFLMDLYQKEQLPDALSMTEITLKAMAAGGIFDQIEGGFSRYSTDETWLIPHFEKMLYDNVLLLALYSEAFRLTKNDFYRDIARRTADYLLTELAGPKGGFFCGQDADSEGTEGSYYLFTKEEVTRLLGPEEGADFCRLYNITEKGNFDGKNVPNRIGQTEKGWKADDPRLKALSRYRKARMPLPLDHKILLSWNGWAILAFAKAGQALDDSRYLEAAKNTSKFLKENMTDSRGRLYLRYCQKEASFPGQLDDYAVYALALRELYHSTFDVSYLEEAILLARQMTELFEDRENNGYFMTAHDAKELIFRPKETYDGAIPSGNSAAAMVLTELSFLTGDSFFLEAAHRQHRFLAAEAQNYPAAHCFALSAMARFLYPHRELVCTGAKVPLELAAYLRDHSSHDLTVLFKSAENESRLSAVAPFTAAYPVSEQTVYYLCENGTCHAPVTDFEELGLF
ncbi:MAG: thioredoxin domain-containing protein [Lachnospiraceae bacterium]|jgi:uncharacterized protein YyaL (SSP411 family)|nr:thioredoxin domain-containing protein [Lachnospiraceae bacterium]